MFYRLSENECGCVGFRPTHWSTSLNEDAHICVMLGGELAHIQCFMRGFMLCTPLKGLIVLCCVCVCFSSKFFVRGIWKLLSFVLNDSIYEFVGMIYTTESSLCRSKFSEKHPTQCCALYFCQGSMCAGDSSHCKNIYI